MKTPITSILRARSVGRWLASYARSLDQIPRLAAIVLTFAGGSLAPAAITSYGDGITDTSPIYQISVRKVGDPTGTPIYVHNYWDHNGSGDETNIKFLHYAHFGASQADFDAGVEVEITYFENIVPGDTRVSPLAYGITPAIVGGNKLKFTLHQPKKLFVAINLPLVASMNTQYYKTRYLLMLMPDLAEVVPSGPGVTTVTAAQGVSAVNAAIASAPVNGTVVMAAGTYTGEVDINRGDVTLYLAPGAYLKNTMPPPDDTVQKITALKILAGNSNVTVKGRGVVEAWQQVIDVKDCTNVTLDGIIIRATGRQWTGRPIGNDGKPIAAGLAFWPQRTNDSFFRNLKVLRYPPSPRTADGIDPASCHNVAITDCMVYSGDDSICFKQEQNAQNLYDNLLQDNVAFTPTSGFKYGNTLKLTVDGDVWRDNYSVYGQLQFSNAGAPEGILRTITNQVVENITVENSEHAFLSIGVVRYDTPYVNNLDLVIDNLTVNKVWQTPPYYDTSEPAKPLIKGYCGIYAKADPDKTINLTFNNLKVEGDYIHNMAELIAKMGGNEPFVGGRSVATGWTADHPNGEGTVNVYFNVFNTPPTGAPSGLTVTGVTATTVDLQWSNTGVSGQTGFRIDRALDANFTTGPAPIIDAYEVPNLLATTGTATGLTPDTEYFFRVHAFNTSGNGADSPVVSQRTEPAGGGGTPLVYEAEAGQPPMTRTSSAGDTLTTITPGTPGLSGSAILLTADSGTTGDFAAYTISGIPAGTYNVAAQFHRNKFRAIAQLFVDDQPVGSPYDSSIEPTAPVDVFEQSFGSATLTGTGSHTFKFVVTGRTEHAGVTYTNYQVAVDYIKLAPAAANTPPTAGDDGYTVAEGGTLAIAAPGVLANDNDPQSNPLTAVLVAGPMRASSFTLNPNGGFTYTHDGGETTSDSFTYRANDGTADSNVATVTLTITPVNDPPVANPQSVSTNEDTAVAVTLTGSDPESSALSYAVVTGPANGTLTGTAPSLTYTPAADYNGSDSFTFKVNDGTVDSAAATVGINITAVNDAPSFTKGANQTVTAGAGAQTVANWATGFTPGPADESAQTVAAYVVTNDTNALFTAQPAVASNGTLTYTPVANVATPTTATVTVQVRDNGGTANGGVDLSAAQTFTITVNPAASNPNLALNPGFETDPTVNYATNGTATYTWATDAFHGGSRSIKNVSTQPAGTLTRWFSKITQIPATPGASYTVSAWLKTANVTDHAQITVNFWNAASQVLQNNSSSTLVGTAGWTQKTVSATAPANTAYIRVEFRLYGSGTLWADDVSIIQN